MNDKIKDAQSNISGMTVAKMIMDFNNEFRDIYGYNTLTSMLCAVGPLQSMIGLGIKNGYLWSDPNLIPENITTNIGGEVSTDDIVAHLKGIRTLSTEQLWDALNELHSTRISNGEKK